MVWKEGLNMVVVLSAWRTEMTITSPHYPTGYSSASAAPRVAAFGRHEDHPVNVTMSFIYMALAARQILCPKSWPNVAVRRMSRQQNSQ
jgi:hypothetical protein